MSGAGHEIATAYISVVPSMEGIQADLGKMMTGVAKGLSKEVDSVPQSFSRALGKVRNQMDKAAGGLMDSTQKGITEALGLVGALGARALGVKGAFDKSSPAVQRLASQTKRVADSAKALWDGWRYKSLESLSGSYKKMGELGLRARVLHSDFSMGWDKTSESLKGLWGDTAQGFAKIKTAANASMRPIVEWAVNVKDTYRKEFGAVPRYASNPLREVTRIAGSVTRFIQERADKIRTAYSFGFAGIEGPARSHLAGVLATVGRKSRAISDWADKIRSSFVYGFRGVPDSAASGMARLVQAVGSGIRKAVDRVDTIKPAFKTAFFGIDAPAEKGLARVAQIVGGKAGEIAANAEVIKRRFQQGFQGIEVDTDKTFERLANTAGRVIGPIAELFEGFGEKTKAAFGKIAPAAGEAFKKMTEYAAEGVKGVIDISKKMVDGVKGALKGVAGAIKETFQGPATVALTVGVATMGVALKKGLGRLDTIDVARKKMVGLGIDTQQSARIMEAAEQSVLGTVYGLDEAATIASGAIAAGVKEGKDLDDTLKAMVNTAAASNRPLADIGYIFNNVAATNQAYTQQINQVAQSGIPMWQELAKVMGVNENEIRKLVSTGAVGFEEFREAAMNATGDIADEMGKTLPGALENFHNAISRLGANIWKGFESTGGDGEAVYSGIYQHLAPLVIAATKAIKPLERMAGNLGNTIGEKLNPVIQKFTEFLQFFTDRSNRAAEAMKKVAGPLGATSQDAARLAGAVEPVADKFGNLLEVLKPFAAIIIPLGAAGMGDLTQIFGRWRPLLGPIPKLLGAVGSGGMIAAVGLGALAKVDPTKMAAGLSDIAASMPDMVRSMTGKLQDVAYKAIPQFVAALTENLPIVVDGATEIVEALVTGLSRDQTAIKMAVTRIFEDLAGMVDALLPTVVLAVTDLIPMIVDLVLGGLPMLLDATTVLLESLADAFVAMVPALTELAFTIIENLTLSILEFAPQFIETGLYLIISFADAILSKLPMMLGLFAELLNAIIESVVGMVPMLVDAIVEAIPMVIEAGMGVVEGLADSLVDVVQTLGDAVIAALPLIVELLRDGLPLLIEGAVDLFMGLVVGLTEVVSELVAAVVELIPPVIDALIELMPILLDSAIVFFMALVEALPEIIPPLVDAIMLLLPPIVEALVTLIPQLIEGALVFFMAVVEALPDIIPPLIEAIVNMVDVIVEGLVELIPFLLVGALHFFMAIVEALPRIIGPLIGAVFSMIGAVVEFIVSSIPMLFAAGVEMFLAFVSAIPSIIGNLWEELQNLWDRIAQFFKELPGKMMTFGKDLIDGLIQGIKDKFTAGVDAIKDLGGKMLDGFKGFFGISSPSEVMAQMGGYLDEGVSEGVRGGAASVESVKGLADDVLAIMAQLETNVRGAASGIGAAVLTIIPPLQRLMKMMRGQFRNTITKEIKVVAKAFQVDLPKAVAVSTKLLQGHLASFQSWFARGFGNQMAKVVTQIVKQLQKEFAKFGSWFSGAFSRALATSSKRATDGMRRSFETFQRWFSGGFRTTITRTIKGIQDAFTKMPSAVASSWNNLRAATRNPTNYVIQTVYMNGIRSAVNAINRSVGVSGSMPAVSSIGHAKGAPQVLPGYTPGRDVHSFYNPKFGFLRLSGGEAILRPEVTRALGGAPTINAWNRTRGRGVGSVGDRGYAKGGILDFLRKSRDGWSVNTKPMRFGGKVFDDPAAAIRSLVTNPAKEYGARAGGGHWGKAMAGAMADVPKQYESVFAKKVDKLGLAGLVKAARGAIGYPYIWGGSSIPPGVDCSGLVYWALNRMGKDAPRLTAAGYQAVSTPVSSPRPGDVVFWGNPASHIAISTGGSGIIHASRPGVPIGEASLYGNPTFAKLPYDDGGWLMPGLTLAENRTGKPEPVFTSDQWDRMGRGAGVVYNDNRQIYNPVAEPDSIQVAKNLQRASAGVGGLG